MSFRPQYKATPPTLTEGQFSSGLLDVNGNLKVAVTGGSSSTVAIDQTTPGTTNGVVVNSVTGNVSVVPGSTETKITAATIPAGGVGFVGWLSAIWYQLTQILTITGSVASGATDSGNPVKIGSVYNSTMPVLTTGQRGDTQVDPSGNLRVRMIASSVSGVDAVANTALSAAQITSNTAEASLRPLSTASFMFNGSSWDRFRKPNAVSRIVSVAATTNATVAKASAGDLMKIIGFKATALPCYLKIYNKATAPTVGTDVPILTIPLNATALFDYNFNSLYFSTGISYAITLLPADNDTTAIAAADVLGLNIVYA